MSNWIADLIGWKPNGTDPIPDPARPTVDPVAILNQNYDLIMGALTIWKEGRGEPLEGKLAIWWVIKNRLAAGWGSSLLAVVMAPKQFSCWNRDDVNLGLFPTHLDPSWQECLTVVLGSDPDPTGGAKYYFNPSVASPSWAIRMIQTVKIGNHAFYREA